MNAPVFIEPSLSSAHRAAVEEANCWRGRCVNLFARGERIVSEALIAFHGHAKLPMLTSQRLDRLSKALDDKPRTAKALAAFGDLADVRNVIVHGESRVFIDVNGKWLLHLTWFDRTGNVQRVIDQAEGEKLVRQVHQCVQRLGSLLAPSSQTPGRAGTPCA